MSLRAEGWGWRYASRSEWACQEINFDIQPGEKVLLLGASGSGKSTLLRAVAGVLGGADEGDEVGRLLVDGVHPSRLRGRVGLVMQDPQSQLILSRLGDDVAFGLENLRVPTEQIWPLVDASLAAVGLGALPRDHATAQLSGGQQQRLAIAGALAMFAVQDANAAPAVLCLDEPTANLDPVGVREVRDTIVNLAAQQPDVTLLIVEHRVDIWADVVDRVIVLAAARDGGGVIADGPPTQVLTKHAALLTEAGIWVPGVPAPGTRRELSAPSSTILHSEQLSTGYRAEQPISTDLDVQIPAGRSTVITGPNGAGKSTLAMTMAGLLPPLAGRVVAAEQLRPAAEEARRGLWRRRRKRDVGSPHAWTSRELLTRLGTVFQHPEHQFVESSVRAELAVGLKALGRPEAQIVQRTDELLARMRLTQLADANPFTLSGGEQRRLSVATVLATSPAVVFLDEPTFGQDRNTWAELVAMISELLAEDVTIVSVTHDAQYLDVLGEHHIRLNPAGEVSL